MNTSQLKSFAQQSRKALMDTVSGKLDYVLDENSLARRESASAVSALEGLIKEIGKEQVIEKVAYTWFNRFCALRYMDVNRYNKIGIVSPVEGQTQPEILAEAKMNYIDDSIVPADKIADIRNLLNGTKTSKDPQGEAYKLLFVSYCNSLNKQLPFMFEKISDYTELLLPDDLLAQNSVLSNTIEVLDAETCKDIEVIGWLYQYYISEKKDEVFAELKKGKKISKENVPAATQIFTPKWIVSYMVENSVGKLWLESHPDERLQSQFKYYLESAEQEPEVQAKLDELINKDLKPQDIKVLDPACGSGHILVKAFDVLFEIYKSQGWQENEIPEMILKNNLYGLDICDRAAQLAQFAVMMKARQYDRTIFNKVTELNICSIKDTNWVDFHVAQELLKGVKDEKLANEQIKLLQETFKDAKEYGSIIDVKGFDFNFWQERIDYFNNIGQATLYTPIIRGRLWYSIRQAKIMQKTYECLVTNPPYMGSGGMGVQLTEFVKKNYKDTKSDMSTVFMEKTLKMIKNNGFMSMINIPVWMFLSSYGKLRENLIKNNTLISMLHFGRGIFGSDFGSVAFVFNKSHINKFTGSYRKLFKKQGAVDSVETKEKWFFEKIGSYQANQNNFLNIPGYPIVYWLSENLIKAISNEKLDKYIDLVEGVHTRDNEQFLRFWHEVSINKSALYKYDTDKKWYPYNKGGSFRQWYGNNEYVINWEHDGKSVKSFKKSSIGNSEHYFEEGITFTIVTSARNSFRYSPIGAIYDVSGPTIYAKNPSILKYLLGYLTSKLVFTILRAYNPTISIQIGDIKKLPFIYSNEYTNKINELVNKNIEIAEEDWDSFENSWNFKIHPLIMFSNRYKDLVNSNNMYNSEPITDGDKVEECFNKWKTYKSNRYEEFKQNETEINQIFLNIFGVSNEIDAKAEDDYIALRNADEKREIKSLLSYAVGCMFGRYSLDEKGLAFAGGEFDLSKYKSFPADEDAVIPVLSEHLFSDDITSRFKEFLKVAFGETYFEENLEYVASVLGKKNTETADDTIRNYFMKDFYNDHIKMYQKRPIYWMFSSPKGNFNALVYMHRYNKDTASVILNSYLRNYRDEKLKAQIENCKQIELSASTSQGDKIKASKRREELEKIVKEVTDYERDILYPLATERKEIDLDDGVKVNYLKFGKALKDFGLKAKK